MGRPKKQAAAPIEPEDENQELPEEQRALEATPPDPPARASRTRRTQVSISKADAVREAIAQGKDSPEQGTDYIRSQYGIEMSRQMFSSYKSQGKAREGKKAGSKSAAPKAKPGRKPKAASQAVEGYVAPPPRQRGSEGDLIESLETLKPLIALYGPEKVKRLVDLLG